MIHIVIGTKAQLIKMAPIMRRLSLLDIEYNYIYTGQHRDTMEDIHRNFSIKSFDKVLHNKGDIVSVLAMFIWFFKILSITLFNSKDIFNNDKNGVVLVHGDTISTLLGAIMGKFAGVKVAHVESGLRSFNLLHPFPEEITRVLTFKLSDYSFCPGSWAVKNLKRYKMVKIDTVNNTLYDSLTEAMPLINSYKDINIPDSKYVVVTIHRFENLNNLNRMKELLDILNNLSEKFKVLFILHKPTKKALNKYKLMEKFSSKIEFRERYDYFRFIGLVSSSEFIISDGGSNQEECYYLGKPVLLYRKATERGEGIGINCVVSRYERDTIFSFFNNYENYKRDFLKIEESPSDLIIENLRKFYLSKTKL
ncbi:MAG: hypothetical protein CR982_06575 [Candidatus Cloacimonadota bacterium]|nr:MAG: hypothetical protein CR982_06575 [Candidatus Cloacimonadota bacterium]PIE79954.1 MAG: hypothetical protein CSA15_02495 [Candidatus Delongbacteria bacterium]